jgi:hypothetical protein
MPDPNLTAALQGSLEIVTANPESPLTEATPDSVDILLDRINSAFAEGLPEKLTDETLRQVITVYRSQALRWTQEEEIKKAKGPRTRKAVPLGVAFDLGELDDLELGK